MAVGGEEGEVEAWGFSLEQIGGDFGGDGRVRLSPLPVWSICIKCHSFCACRICAFWIVSQWGLSGNKVR
jgi:hypothetical protein